MIAAARCRAELDYDYERGVPLSAFLYQRALTCAWTRYRQEWAYALRFRQADGNGRNEPATPQPSQWEADSPDDLLQHALLELPFADRWLIRQLFWSKTTEDRLAKTLQISQQAVSKRKGRILARLRRTLNGERSGLPISKIIGWCTVLLDWMDFDVVCNSWL